MKAAKQRPPSGKGAMRPNNEDINFTNYGDADLQRNLDKMHDDISKPLLRCYDLCKTTLIGDTTTPV